MKGKRLIATMLALLLMVSLLPMTALADETVNNESNVTLDKNYDKNIGDTVRVPVNITVGTNEGQVVENYGIVETNSKYVDMNYGAVNTNNGYVMYNEGAVNTNNGYVSDNVGTVGTNNKEVDMNYKNITTNNGSVSTNFGTVEANDGTVELNLGTVEINDDTVNKNHGTVGTNNGRVETNRNSGIIETNNNYVDLNYGAVNTNNDDVVYNAGTVGTNNGNVYINDNNITTNNGSVSTNFSTVETNNGTVEENCGTVETNAIDGVVNNCSMEPAAAYANEDTVPSEEEPVVLDGKVENNFGTVVDKTNPDEVKTYYGLSWGDNVQSLTLLKGDVAAQSTLNLNAEAAKASRDGYKMTGFTAFARKNGAEAQITDTTNYLMDAPVWLQILWEKITGKPASSNAPETQPTRTPVYTKLSAEKVKVGAFVRCGNMTFKIIEVNDDSIRVATVGKLSDTALTDMLGFLKQHLSDAQIAKLMGAPELLEQELVAKFFGGSNEHISFYASPDLFA